MFTTCIVICTAMAVEPSSEASNLFPPARSYMEKRAAEFDQIPVDRKAELTKLAVYVQDRAKAIKPVRLTFICTHNSRRSQMSQIWAAAAARFYGVNRVETFSGGTEATAFNSRALAAVKRAGLKVETTEGGKNPHYSVRFHDSGEPLVCYSKVYDQTPNPNNDFCAVMTCSRADKNCPIIEGCSLRISIPFEDPKVADDQPDEEATYDERCQQICREMLYLFSQVES